MEVVVKMTSMMAGKQGYRDIISFSNDGEMSSVYFGVIARGKRYFLSRYVNVNDGKHALVELTQDESEEIQNEYEDGGWTQEFIEKWMGKIT